MSLKFYFKKKKKKSNFPGKAEKDVCNFRKISPLDLQYGFVKNCSYYR